jgi:hypothetical protein
MFDSIVRAVLAHKEIVIAATAFAVLTGYLSTAFPNATAQPINLGTINVVVTPDGDVFIRFDDSYVNVFDGTVAISLDDLDDLSGFGSGFL